jgi:type IV secretory pathway VirB2 component (pilin)
MQSRAEIFAQPAARARRAAGTDAAGAAERSSNGGALRPACAALYRRQPQLAAGAGIALLGALATLAAMQLDARTLYDVNVWIKPTKFFVSLAVYYATLAWVFGYLPQQTHRSRAGRFVIFAPLAVGVYEMTWIVAAAAIGIPSHFNAESPLWIMAYRLGGVGSLLLIVAILVQGLMVARQRTVTLAPALRAGIVAGAVIAFGATLITAGYLSASGSHWVGGVPSDAGGLPLFGWSRTGGDLRVAHFFALHAQQVLPALGLLAVRAGRPDARGLVAAGAAVYVALIVYTFVQALRGVPFLG